MPCGDVHGRLSRTHTDAGGIVFHGNPLKFMERARTEWLRTLGFDQEGLRNEGRIRIGWVQAVPGETPGAEPRLKTGRIPQRILDRLPEALPEAAAPQD